MSPTTALSSPAASSTNTHGCFKNPVCYFKQSSLFASVRWEHLIAGVSGGVISTIALHPLDLLKIRLQVNDSKSSIPPTSSTNLNTAHKVVRPQYKGLLDTFTSIVKLAGIKGLYQGVVPNVVGAGSSWGLYFLAYNTLKTHRLKNRQDVALDAHVHMWLASQAGVFTLIFTNPIWVAKTRLCLQYDQTMSGRTQFSKLDQKHYRGMTDCLVKTFKSEGVSGFYKGFVPGLIGVSHGALQFMAYEELKKLYTSHYHLPHDSKLGTKEYLCFAALSKIFAATATYPYQVVRSRLQDQHRKYVGLVGVIRETYSHEGWRGFYKGMVPGVLKVTPACCITFVVYERIVQLVQQQRSIGSA